MGKFTKSRKVKFTDAQMLIAKGTGKFDSPPGTPMLEQHRPFIAWLFRTQHKCFVNDHTKLRYNYLTNNGVCVIEVEGDLGSALHSM